MPKLTIDALHSKFPNWEVSFTRNTDGYGTFFGKRRYHLKHKPSGKISACILGNNLESVQRLIAETEENPDFYLNNRSYFVLPQ